MRIDLSLPAGRLSVNHQAKDDPTVAIREAFDAARWRMEDFAREQRRDVKTHEPGARAEVTFVEEAGVEGSQASTVIVTGKHLKAVR